MSLNFKQLRIPFKSKTWLFLLPILFFISGCIYIESMGYYFLKCVDPEYSYLFNGLLFANLKFNIAFIENPGTPLQILVALVMRIVHVFRPGVPLLTDVLQNPELYIKATLYSLNILGFLALWTLGFYTLRFTGSFVTALFMQLTPFCHILPLELHARVMPESLMVIVIIFWLILLLRLMAKKDLQVSGNQYDIAFAILTGLSIATKLTFLPFLLLPLMLLPGYRQKFRYFVFSIFFFFLFAFPVILRLNYFILWIKNILTHTGSYGSGDKGFVKWNEFAAHLHFQLQNGKVLFWFCSLLLILVVLVFVIRKKQNDTLRLYLRISVGIILVIFTEIFITSKHFAFHYLVPVLLLAPFVLLLAFRIAGELFPKLFTRKRTKILLAITGSVLFLSIIPRTTQQVKEIRKSGRQKIEAYKTVRPYLEQTPKIICPSYYGCSAIEYALTFGLHMSGRYKPLVYAEMKKIYPETYLYFPWSKVFIKGYRDIQPMEFIKVGTTYRLYIAEYNRDVLQDIIRVMKFDIEDREIECRKIYENPDTKEAVFDVRIIK